MDRNEKVLKASDQRDIIWSASSACYLRRHWPECFRCVKQTFCFTGPIDVLQGAVVQKADQRLTWVSFSFVKKLIIFSVIFKSVQSSTCWQNEAFTSEFTFRTNPPLLGYLNTALNNPAQVLLKSKQLTSFRCNH